MVIIVVEFILDNIKHRNYASVYAVYVLSIVRNFTASFVTYFLPLQYQAVLTVFCSQTPSNCFLDVLGMKFH
jgi:hypothetical protein